MGPDRSHVQQIFNDFADRVGIEEIEMQGTVLVPLKCSTQIDSIGKGCFETTDRLLKYKECV